MKLLRCPRCELNYMKSDEQFCSVCTRLLKGGLKEDTQELCIECGISPSMPGEDLCRSCLREALGKASLVAQVVAVPDDNSEEPPLAVEEELFEPMDELAEDLAEETPAPEEDEIDAPLDISLSIAAEMSLSMVEEEEEARNSDEEDAAEI